MVIELQVIAGVGFRSLRPKSIGLGQNLPGHDEHHHQALFCWLHFESDGANDLERI
jgi:hypothetical protein